MQMDNQLDNWRDARIWLLELRSFVSHIVMAQNWRDIYGIPKTRQIVGKKKEVNVLDATGERMRQ